MPGIKKVSGGQTDPAVVAFLRTLTDQEAGRGGPRHRETVDRESACCWWLAGAVMSRRSPWLVCLALVGCGHVIHPAAVQPGFTLDVLGGATLVRHEPMGPYGGPTRNDYLEPPGKFDPYSSWRPAVQLGAGYGWRFSRNVGFQPQIAVGNRTPPTLDTYLQLIGWPLDAGVGALGTFGHFGAYAMIGKGLPLGGRTELRLDAGARLLFEIADGPKEGRATMALLSLRHGAFAAGLWSDNTFFDSASYDIYCDETCKPANFARWRASGGVYLRMATRLMGGN